jgi:hypothetical protein
VPAEGRTDLVIAGKDVRENNPREESMQKKSPLVRAGLNLYQRRRYRGDRKDVIDRVACRPITIGNMLMRVGE